MKNYLKVILLLAIPLNSFSQSTITIKHPQGAVVSAAYMNVFYVGVDNPIIVNYHNQKSFLLKSNMGTIGEKEGNYFIHFDRTGSCKLTVSDLNGKNEIEYKFKVKRLPTPTPTLSSRYHDGDTIDKKIFLATKIILVLEAFDFQLFYETTSFSVFITTTTGEIKRYENAGVQYSGELLEAFSQLNAGDKVLFYKIRGKMKGAEDEIDVNEPLEITIK